VGVSGAGKSTIRGLAVSQGAETLADDLVLLRPSGSLVKGAHLVRTPDWERTGPDAAQPGEPEVEVGRVYLLKQGSALKIESLSQAASVASLVTRPPILGEDIEGMMGTTQSVVKNLSDGCAFRLTFSLDPDIIRSVISP
jgi:hypothetical protein